MDTSYIVLLVIQSILIVALAYFINLIIKESKLVRFEKRLDEYSLTSTIDSDEPFFETFYKSYWKLIKNISNILDKSEIFIKYSKKYKKYISYDNLSKKNEMDYISIKIIISFIIGILYVLSSLIKIEFNIYLLIILLTSSFFLYDIYLNIKYKKQKKEIENELLSAIIIMNNAFKSGMNIMQAVDIVKTELTGSIQDEFKKVSMDISYGLSLETVFERFYNRVKLEDIKSISTSLSLINKTGGNIVRVFNAIEKNFYDKKKIKDEMNSLTSSSIFMFRLLTIMPAILIFIVYLLDPKYFMPFITTALGRLILLIIIILFVIYILVVKKVLKVKV